MGYLSEIIVVLLSLRSIVATDTMNLLMVGNSYTARNNLSHMLSSLLGEGLSSDNIQVSRNTKGGASLTTHLQEADGTAGDTGLRQSLVSNPKPWDFVVLQDQSQIPGYYEVSGFFDQSLQSAVKLNELIEDTGAETIFFLTWGRRDGDSRNHWIFPDFPTMQERLIEGYRQFAEATSSETRRTTVAPVGPAFQIIYDRYLELRMDPLDSESNFYNLYSSDGSHPSRSGTYLAACVLYATVTGKDPSALKYRPTGISNDLQDMLQSVAAFAVMGKSFDFDTVVGYMEQEIAVSESPSPSFSSAAPTPRPTRRPTRAPSLRPISPPPKSWDDECSSLVENSNMELGHEGFWYAQGVSDVIDTSGYKSALAIRSINRNREWDGPAYMMNSSKDRNCMVQGSTWQITASLQMIDPKTERGAECELSSGGRKNDCPGLRFRFRDSRWDLQEFRLQEYAGDAWNPNGFNQFKVEFTVPKNSDTWHGEIRNIVVFFADFPAYLDLVIDDFNIVRVQ
jgi:hypothetical protein